MYLDAMSFLEEEREAWRPFEALGDFDDATLERQIDKAHGWSGRDLLGHLLFWQLLALEVARELAVNERSLAKERADRDWAERGDIINDEAVLAWRAKPMAEVRRELERIPGELRGTLTVVPEVRWLKNPDMLRFFLTETTNHYQEHGDDLAEIVWAAREEHD
jgi:hypothetical protein